MGCNSHLSIEVKRWNFNPKLWECWAKDLPESRDYSLYGYMAGVRGNDKPVAQPRGIPKDLSEEVKGWFNQWGSDFHSHTWLSPSEFYTAYQLVVDDRHTGDLPTHSLATSNDFMAKEWVVLLETLRILEQHYGNDKVRLVVAFDN